MKIISFVVSLFVAFIWFLPENVAAIPPEGPDHFSPVKLRGYGTLSGERTVFGQDGQSSLLEITCESVPKAQLVLSKYLSDLGLLPGVTALPLTTSHGPLAARQIEDQGVVAAVRSGNNVLILTSVDGPTLQTLYESRVASKMKIDAADTEVAVPMYLDRWDKYGFRFYYNPFGKPQGALTYDPQQDFDFAKQSGNAGLVIWNSPWRDPSAEGIMDFNSLAWAYKAGQKFQLPMGVNDGFFDSIGGLANLYPQSMTPYADQYLGGWHGTLDLGIGSTISWGSDEVQDVMMGQMQTLVRKLNPNPSVVNWLEPHEEMSHGITDILDDHGPDARSNFNDFLKSKYGTPSAVAARWQLTGTYNSWDDVPFPEAATFMGWNAAALDLKGLWKISYDATYGADSAKTDLDDSQWPSIEAPGHAIVEALPRKPAVFRRHIQVDGAWLAAHPKVWLYEFDFNNTRDEPTNDVLVFVNGQAVSENPPRRTDTHWSVIDVTSVLKQGDNQITFCLPQALLDYRVYLSGEAPQTYPALEKGEDAMWVDFSDWTEWSRGQAVRRGMQMIRQVDPDRPITLMAPDSYMGEIQKAAQDYGGILHDTGGMAGSWGDMHPMMAQSTGLPSDCEPGNGAPTLDGIEGFKCFMGRWSTEGTNGIDYFMHIGDIEWNPEIRDYFTKTLNLWHLFGKYHVPQPELAILNSPRDFRLTGFPWNSAEAAPDLVQGSKFWYLINDLLAEYPRAAVLEDDFARGNADKFRVILDGNTTIMDPELVDQIEQWVERGGIFITYQQTGRHTPTALNAWPISKLTGYAVTGIDKLRPDGTVVTPRGLHLVAGQNVFDDGVADWKNVRQGGGLSLQKIDPACEDLLEWDDGTVAAGLCKRGKGMVIDLGSNSAFLPRQVLEWLKVGRVPIESSEPAITTRHYVSNNGLYDIWAMWNSENKPLTSTFTFRDGFNPGSCHDANTGEGIPVDVDSDGARLSTLSFDPWQTRVFLSPRRQLANAPTAWFALQRSWWSGTADPGKPIPAFKSKFCMDLDDDWAVKILPEAGAAEGTPLEDPSLASPTMDDATWPRAELGIFDFPDNTEAHHVLYRKTFTVPPDWDQGRVMMYTHTDLLGGFRRYLDGQPMRPVDADDDLGGVLKAGSTHTLAVEMWGAGAPSGMQDPIYLSYRPDPVGQQEIANWAYAPDRLNYQEALPLPQTGNGSGTFRAMVTIDPKESIHNVFVHFGSNVDGFIINGHWIAGNRNMYTYIDVNITPWVKYGSPNELIAAMHQTTTLTEARLEYYGKGVYP